MKDATSFTQDYFKNMSDFYKNFDFSAMMPNGSLKSGHKNTEVFFDLIQLMNDKSQMILKKQMEIFQDNCEEMFNAVKELGEGKLDQKEMSEKQNDFTHKCTTRNLQHATELGALYTQASSEIFRKYSDQMQNTVNSAKKASSSKSEK
jgi:hypothetical protein